MTRTRPLLPGFFALALLALPAPASANLATTCWFGVVDMTSVSGTDPDGTYWEYVTYYYGWTCTDGYLADERPYDPSTVGGGTPINPPPPPPPPSGCSLTACLADCSAAYLRNAGVEVIGDTVLEHYTGGTCGIYCMESERLSFDVCRATCVETCNLP